MKKKFRKWKNRIALLVTFNTDNFLISKYWSFCIRSFEILTPTRKEFLIYLLKIFCVWNNTILDCKKKGIYKNINNQGRIMWSPGPPKKKVFCGVHRNSRLDYLNSKKQKDFVNLIDYLVINGRNKQNIDF